MARNGAPGLPEKQTKVSVQDTRTWGTVLYLAVWVLMARLTKVYLLFFVLTTISRMD